MTWVILPFLQEYENAGEFTHEGKIKRSLYNNGIFYAFMFGFGLIFVIYLLIQGNIELGSLVEFLMALSNAYGTFLIILLLGYGLVKLP